MTPPWLHAQARSGKAWRGGEGRCEGAWHTEPRVVTPPSPTHTDGHTPSENSTSTSLLLSFSLSQHAGRQLASPPLLAAITLIITLSITCSAPPRGGTVGQLAKRENYKEQEEEVDVHTEARHAVTIKGANITNHSVYRPENDVPQSGVTSLSAG